MADVQLGERVREERRGAGLSQAALADRAGMSRAALGALEQGRHMPAADTAVRLARALGTTVERLLAARPVAPSPVGPVGPAPLPEAGPVRAARVGDRLVARPVDPFADGAAADGVHRLGRLHPFAGASPRGAAVAGCDPLLGLAEGLLERAGGARVVAAQATSGQALEALAAGRCHAALVHGPAGPAGPAVTAASLPPLADCARWHVAAWRTGLASHPRLGRPSLEALLADDVPTIAREGSAASQQAVDRAARRLGLRRAVAPARTAPGHVQAARAAVEHEAVAVTSEPAALAAGLDFLALETHAVELWVPARWTAEPGVEALLDLLHAPAFRDRAATLPAYDLTDSGAAR